MKSIYCKVFTLTILFILLFPAIQALAGDCMEPEETYLEYLKKQTSEMMQEAMYCFRPSLPYYVMGYEHFASPTVLKKLSDENKELRPKLIKLIAPLLTAKNKDIKCQAARTLAYHAYPQAYGPLKQCTQSINLTQIRKSKYKNMESLLEETYASAVLFGILKNPQILPWIYQQYWSLDELYRNKPDFSYKGKMVYLNAVYHIGSKDALPFLNKIIADPRPAKIVDQAIKIKEHLQ